MSQYKNCILCGSNTHLRVGKIRTSRVIVANKILECDYCSFVFLDDFSHITRNHYQESKMHDGDQSLEDSRNQTKQDDLRRYSMLQNEIYGKNILEVGSGNGGFLKLVQNIAKSIKGIEPEIKHHKIFSEELLNIDSYENISTQKQVFNIIVSFHVIEHVSDPVTFLTSLLELLEEGGKIYIETPNSNDALIKLYNSEAFQEFTYWDNHLILFNNKSFEFMCSKFRNITYRAIPVQRYGLANHLYWLSKGKPNGHNSWFFLEDELINSQYQEKLSQLHMNDTLFYEITKIAK